jgi:hypothetical protein
MITAKPDGASIVPGSLTPASCSSRRPQPNESRTRTSGKTIQASSKVGPAYRTGAMAPEATSFRLTLGDGSKTSIW